MMKTLGTLLITTCLAVAISGCATDPPATTAPEGAKLHDAIAVMHQLEQDHTTPKPIADRCDTTGSNLDDGVCCYEGGGCDMCVYNGSYGWHMRGSSCCDQGDGTDFCCAWG